MFKRFPLFTEKARRLSAKISSSLWQPYSRLVLKSDGGVWSFSHDMQMLAFICQKLGIELVSQKYLSDINNQSIFYASRYELLRSQPWKSNRNRFATSYFHGKPGYGNKNFDTAYNMLRESHGYIHRIHVSHVEMRDIILNSGIDPAKVFLIPIGIEIDVFQLQTPESRNAARKKYDIPQSAVTIGSFQKDGIGWEDGSRPKLVKGPDTFLAAIKILKQKVPNLLVVLTGPARGYVMRGLQEMNVPFRHIYFKDPQEVADMYHTLDLYIIPSRQEGGPKAALEAMATGVPLVSTRVGQASDLIQSGENGWLANVEDAEGLAHWAQIALQLDTSAKYKIIQTARKTAEENSYAAQVPLWKELLKGFVKTP